MSKSNNKQAPENNKSKNQINANNCPSNFKNDSEVEIVRDVKNSKNGKNSKN